MRRGRLPAGTALSSSRALARDLGIARNTVAEAYGQLVAEGWLTARHGSGTWVAERAAPGQQAVRRTAGPSAPATRYDLRPGTPDLSAFPRTAWPSPARPGLAGEAYGPTGPRRLAEAEGLALAPLPVDGRGAVVRGDDETLGGTAAMLLTPAHQFPLGVALAPDRRRRAIDWAVNTGGLIIEDDYDGEFRYDRQAVGALQSLGPEHVAYGGAAGKSPSPRPPPGSLAPPPRLPPP